jgi:putative sigma-54 modulation protein
VKVTITGRHVAVTQGMRDYAEKRAAKLEEFFSGAKDAHVILGVEKYRHTAELNFKASGRVFTAKKTTKDMYASIDEVVQAVILQAAKQKDKERGQHTRRHRGKPSSIKGMAEAEIPAPKAAAPSKRVTKVKAFAPRPMDLEEAVAELEGSRNGVLAYVNADTQTVHVVFTRPDGSVGLIEEP